MYRIPPSSAAPHPMPILNHSKPTSTEDLAIKQKKLIITTPQNHEIDDLEINDRSNDEDQDEEH